MSAARNIHHSFVSPFSILAGGRAVSAGPGAVITGPGIDSRPEVIRGTDGPRKITLRLAEGSAAGREGELITLAVNPSDTSDQLKEIDTWLGGFENFGYLADQIAPVVLVDQEKARRRDFALENVFERVDTRTGRRGAINELEHMSETQPYETTEYALAAYIPYASEAEAVALYNVKLAHSQTISEKLALDREARVMDFMTTLANWEPGNRTTILAAGKWNGGASSDPLADLHARIRASAGRVTAIVMNEDAAFYFLAHPKVQAYMRQHMGDNAPSPELSRAPQAQAVTTFTLVGYPPIVVSAAKVLNKSTGALDPVLGPDVLLISQPPGVPVDGTKMATAVTFRTKGRSGTGWTSNEFIPQTGGGLEKGTMLEAGYKEVTFFGSNRCGGLIKSVIQN